MLYTTPPSDFDSSFECVSCLIEYDNRILLLLRQDNKVEWNKYWLPGGWVEANETLDIAIKRELKEETWLTTTPHFYRTFYVRYPDYDFKWHIFHTKLNQDPNIKINDKEHKSYLWTTPEQAVQENLVMWTHWWIEIFYNLG